MIQNNRGFALIEMVLIIMILSLLAIFVLVGLNPLEQVKKSRDVGILNRARETLKSAEAYYAFTQSDPVCQDLIDLEYLKSGSCAGLSLSCVNGFCQVVFTAESQTYQDECGGDTTCIVPDDFAD